MKTIVTWQLPIKTASESNSSEHWTRKSKRHRIQKRWVIATFRSARPIVPFPCHVHLTRIAPRKLDEGDNLPGSMKYIRDAVAECLTGIHIAGRADGDDRISWEYAQEKGKVREYAVKIEIKSCDKAH